MGVEAVSNANVLHQALERQGKDPLKSATEEFEAMFISYLLKVMRSTVDSPDEAGELSMGKDLYTDMFDNEIALNIARTRGLGIGEMIYRQLQESGKAGERGHIDQRVASPISGQQPEATGMAAMSPLSSGMSLPLNGRLTSDYGHGRDPLTGIARFHEGLDIAAPAGTPFMAASAGTVVFAGALGDYGSTVILEHDNGGRTLYAHASQILVRPGEWVDGGQAIGLVGSTGRSTGPHLHFETFLSGQHIDPKSLIAPEVSLK